MGGCEKQGNASVRFLGVCPVFVAILFKSVLFVVSVPQYGRLAAIYALLAFNHSACLRNARRISYKRDACGLSPSLEQ